MDGAFSPQSQPQSRPEAGHRELLFVLLCVQAGISLLEALIALLLGSPALMALSLACAALLLVVATGGVRGWRWTRIAATVYESLLLLGVAVRLFLRHGSPTGLTWLLIDLALPLTVIWLCWTLRVRRPANPPERRLVARNSQPAR